MRELSLGQKESFEIALKSLKQNPVLGSGLGTFSYDYFKYRSPETASSFGQIGFNVAGSQFLTNLATAGILGIAALFLLFDLIIFLAIKIFQKAKKTTPDFVLISALFLFVLCQSVAMFLYNFSLSLNFAYFLALAALVQISTKTKKEYKISFKFYKTISTAVFIAAAVFAFGALFLEGQRVVAEIKFGQKNYQAAASLNPSSDLYFRQLAQSYVLKLQSQPDEGDLLKIVSNAVNSAKIATDLGPNNLANWLVRGYVYQNLIGLDDSAKDWAVYSYKKAQELDPQNNDIQKILDSL